MEKMPRTQQEQRRDRVESAVNFFRRLTPENRFVDGQYAMDVFPETVSDSEKSYQWFTRFLEIWYGQIHDVPTRDPKRIESVISVANLLEDTTRRTYRVEMYFPRHSEKATLTETAIELLSQIAHQERTEESQHLFARVLMHYFHFVHPLADGNGRAARAVFAMIDPAVDRAHMTKEQLLDRLISRPENEEHAFRLMRERIGRHLLFTRGIVVPEGQYVDVYNQSQFFQEKLPVTTTFETRYILPTVFHDLMTPEERQKFMPVINGVPSINLQALSLRFSRLARDITMPFFNAPQRGEDDDPIDMLSSEMEHVRKVRAEAVNSVLQFAANATNEFDQEYQQRLRDHFSL